MLSGLRRVSARAAGVLPVRAVLNSASSRGAKTARPSAVSRVIASPPGPSTLYSWGSDSTSALGDESYDLFRSAIRPVQLPPNAYALESVDPAAADAATEPAADDEVTDISTGWTSSLAVTTSGAVYQWGTLWTLRDALSAALFRGRAPRVYRFFQSASFMGRMANRGRSPKPTQLPLFGAKTIADLAKTVGGQRVDIVGSEFDSESVHVVKTAVGAETSAAVTKGGFLFTWTTSGDTVGTLGRPVHSAGAAATAAVAATAAAKTAAAGPDATAAAPISPAADGAGSNLSFSDLWLTATNFVSLSNSAVSTPQVVPALAGHRVTDVAMGFHHLLALTDAGEVFACGKVETGALGLPFEFLDRKQRRFIDSPLSVSAANTTFLSEIRDAVQLEKLKRDQQRARAAADARSAVRGATLAAADAGSPWAAPEADAADPSTLGASKVSELGPVAALAAGFNHSAFVDAQGRVWTCGKNTHGELGLSYDHLGDELVKTVDFRLHYLPTRVRGDLEGHRVAKVACGYHHTVALTETGRVFTWGSNKHGQCGRPHELPTVAAAVGKRGKRAAQQAWALGVGAVRIPGLGMPDVASGGAPLAVVDIACGPYDTALTLSNGRVIFCGTYLDEKGTPRPPFALAEFDPASQVAVSEVAAGQYAPGQVVASIASADAVSPAVRKLDTTATAAAGAVQGARLWAKKIVLGMGYAFALGKPRS